MKFVSVKVHMDTKGCKASGWEKLKKKCVHTRAVVLENRRKQTILDARLGKPIITLLLSLQTQEE